MILHNFDTPEANYERMMQEEPSDFDEVVGEVDGHSIISVLTSFGRLFFVDGTRMAFTTLEQAEKFAERPS
jgi:hypothetical protein